MPNSYLKHSRSRSTTIVTTTTIMIGIRDLGVEALAKGGEEARALVERGIGTPLGKVVLRGAKIEPWNRKRKPAESGNKHNNNGGTINNDGNGYAKTGGRYHDQ